MFYTLIFGSLMVLLYPIAASIELGVSLENSEVWEKFKLFWTSWAFMGTAVQLSFSLFLSLLYAAISENLGHSVLINFFTGKYHRPKQEERIFMFLDMKSSTTIAEELGHVRYFKFLQRYYDDMGDAIIEYQGEVYQYVGDEIVLTWPKKIGINHYNCLRCFFAMKQALLGKAINYETEFGFIPDFKAGMHIGSVTTGEIGTLKKEIVFTGDVLNTAARIQYLCNETGNHLLVTEEMIDKLQLGTELANHNLGEFNLKGKTKNIVIYGFNTIPEILKK